MKRYMTLAGLMLLAAAMIVAGATRAAAQLSAPQTSPCCWDRWNPGWTLRDMWGPRHMGDVMRQRMARHWAFMHQGLPPEYRGARNPLSSSAKTISDGRALYQVNCASCHGKSGMGAGEAAKSLNPSPALLAYMIQRPMAVDGYLLWSISKGGKSFGTAMPAFKDKLGKEEIWKIVIYMRAGFPDQQTHK